ncbi:MAG TPA: aldolase catalytic domain-containing protein [Candidatus Omnitrophota bacterium]|jgi:4-hydroxy 2-oxovalerate aldolase|nr:aldolase catalytic domain-containing protein [Candidatus Omnitrophota bacterium]
MYREQIKVLDCTIRDGGLMNNHTFDDRFVREIYRTISRAGIDYMEIGYKNSRKLFESGKYGAWKFCEDEAILRVIDGIESRTKLSVMVDVGRVDMNDIQPKKKSPVSMIRTACYVQDVDKAIHLANEFAGKGYETAVNLMAISKVRETDLDECLAQLEEECRCDVVYLVDSNGSLYQENIEYLLKKAKGIVKTKEIGIHAHNNQQLAFSNTIEAIIHNANYLDSTIFGMGRAAGNCPTELLLGFLKNPKFDIRPVLDFISREMVPLSKRVEWGYVIPYAITGMLDEHPRLALKLREGDQKENYREFYESLSGSAGID